MVNIESYSESLKLEKLGDLQVVDSIVDSYINIYFSDNNKIRIGREDKPKYIVLSMFSKLTNIHINNIIKKLRNNKKEIKYKNNYLVTLVYMEVLEFGTNNIMC